MKESQKDTLIAFFNIIEVLKRENIVRSDDYIGDIYEFICADLYNIELNKSCREEGYDGIDSNGKKIEIKYHGGEIRTNIIMSKYKNKKIFEELFVILGIKSRIRPSNVPDNTYPIYRIKDYTDGNIGKRFLSNHKYDKLLDHKFDEIK